MLSLNAIAALTDDVARTLSLRIGVAGVTGRAHDGEYAEILLTVLSDSEEPSRLMVGVDRVAPSGDVRRVISEALRDHAEQHRGV